MFYILKREDPPKQNNLLDIYYKCSKKDKFYGNKEYKICNRNDFLLG